MEQVGATEAFVRERDDVLLSLDYERLKAFCAKYGSPIPPPGMALLTMHKARTGATTLPQVARLESAEWLRGRGYSTRQICEPMPGPTHWMPLPAPPFPADKKGGGR